MPQTFFISWIFGELFRPRKFRFSIRTLVVLITLLSFVFGLYVVPAYRAQLAVAALQRAGCQLVWSYQVKNGKLDTTATSGIRPDILELVGPAYFHRVVGLTCPSFDVLHRKPGLEALRRHLPALTHLKSLDLAPGIATDDVLASVARLRRLQSLSLAGSEISDRGLAHLGRLSRLRMLSIHASNISDQGISHLQSLTRLQLLSLDTTTSPQIRLPNQSAGLWILMPQHNALPEFGMPIVQHQTPATAPARGVTNESLRTIGRLPNLVTLCVLSDGVSVDGLSHLTGLTRLQSLQLSDRADASADALTHLQSFSSLQRLALFQTMLSEEDLAALRRTNPKLTSIRSRNFYVVNGRVVEIPLIRPSWPILVPAVPSAMPPSTSIFRDSTNER